MLEINKIYKEDCLVGMQRIDDKSIDCIICDLPYGCTRNPYDVTIPFEPLWEQYKRIIKDNGAIILFAQGMFTAKLMLSNEKMWRYNLIWKKGDRMITGMLFWDKVLIIAFIIFALAIITGILYVNVPLIQLWMIRKLNWLIEKLEAFNNRMSDFDKYDEEWMVYEKWKATNL